MSLKKVLLPSLKVLLTVGIFYYLIDSGKLDLTRLKHLWEYPGVLLQMIAVIAFLILPLMSLRWWVLLKAASIEISLAQANMLTWIGNFFNFTLPGSISGDVIKGFYVSGKKENRKSVVILSLLIDRFTGLFGLILMAFFSMLANWSWIQANPKMEPLVFVIFLLFLGTLLFYGIILFPFEQERDPFIRLLRKVPFGSFFLKVYTTFKMYQHRWKSLLSTLLLSVLTHCLTAYLFIQVSQLLGHKELDFMLQLLVMPLGLLFIAVPVAPGGIGVGHFAFESLYGMVGIANGANIFNLYIILQLAVNLFGGILYLFYRR